MTVQEWVENNYTINKEYNAIYWGDGVFTPVDNFISMFGTVIQTALDNGTDTKQAIRDSDPENKRGYNNLL